MISCFILHAVEPHCVPLPSLSQSGMLEGEQPLLWPYDQMALSAQLPSYDTVWVTFDNNIMASNTA